MSGKKSNRLINATSPYLLQHAHNPVDWYEWGTDAFEKAKKEDKPILVSIGYSSCHWCHVMEREAFENEEVAKIMNDLFVCIKVDREERPDVDQIYMDALQATGVSGGWPLNVFLTPDQNPFYGGTYFPPKNWIHLLLQISRTFKEKRKEIDLSAEDLAKHLNTSDLQRFARPEGPFEKNDFVKIFQNLESKFDNTYGGLDRAPKFVMPTLWMWLLRYHSLSKNDRALEMVVHTLRQLAMGGIYDQIGGGFSRYSVDNRWFAPHFEKMLYDNAQLLSLYAEAYRAKPEPEFKRVIYQTVEWLQNEMMHPEGGFYSAIDADSEGVEGKFYTWTAEELKTALNNNLSDILKYFNATEEGNWEHGKNILFRTKIDEPNEGIKAILQMMLSERAKRVRPSLDDKVLVGWNTMTIQGLLDSYNSIGDPIFLDLAIKNIHFIEKYLIVDGRVYRSYKNKKGETEAFLEDYAFLIKSYIALYQATFKEVWLTKADTWCSYVLKNFWDETGGYFFFSGTSSEKLIARKKEIFDNVIPSSNSVMARNLFHLGILLDKSELKEKALKMVSSLKELTLAEPGHNSNWATLALEITGAFAEILIVGKDALEFRREFMKKDVPFAVFMGTLGTSNLTLLKDKPVTAKTTIYVCYNHACKQPVNTVVEAMTLLQQH